MKNGTHTAEKNHIAELTQVARGVMSKKAYAELLGVDPSVVSRQLVSDYERLITHIDDRNAELQELATTFQANANTLKGEVKRLQDSLNDLQFHATEMQGDFEQAEKKAILLQAEKGALETSLRLLQEVNADLHAELSKWNGQPGIIRRLASTEAKTVMLFLLAAFEGVGSFNLLLDKGIFLALPVSIALAFALLVFTASENKGGKWFCIAFAVAVGLIYFEVTPNWSRYLFAFVPPVIAALLAFSPQKINQWKQPNPPNQN